jgi:hypothetical protein
VRPIFASAVVVGALLLGGCGISINGERGSSLVVNLIAWGAVEAVKSAANAPEAEAAEKRQAIVDKLAEKAGELRDLDFAEIVYFETALQPFANQITQTISATQSKEPPESSLNRRGPIKPLRVKILNSDKVDAYNNPATGEIYLTSALLINSSLRLHQRLRRTGPLGDIPDDADANFKSNCSEEYSPIYRIAVEFDELLNFIIAHEAAHIWLDQSNFTSWDREIEADAWGITLSSQNSPVVSYRAFLERRQFSATSDYQRSMLESRAGSELLMILYESDGILSANAARQGMADRWPTVREKHAEVLKEFSKSLTKQQLSSFARTESLMEFKIPIGDEDDMDFKRRIINHCWS